MLNEEAREVADLVERYKHDSINVYFVKQLPPSEADAPEAEVPFFLPLPSSICSIPPFCPPYVLPRSKVIIKSEPWSCVLSDELGAGMLSFLPVSPQENPPKAAAAIASALSAAAAAACAVVLLSFLGQMF